MLQGKVSFFGESPEEGVGRPLAVIVRLISIQKFQTHYISDCLVSDCSLMMARSVSYYWPCFYHAELFSLGFF